MITAYKIGRKHPVLIWNHKTGDKKEVRIQSEKTSFVVDDKRFDLDTFAEIEVGGSVVKIKVSIENRPTRRTIARFYHESFISV